MWKPRRVIATAGVVAVLVLGGVATAIGAPATTQPSGAGSTRAPLSVSSKSVSAGAWTHTVCQAVDRWETKIKSLGSGVSGEVRAAGSISGARRVLTQFLQKVIDATGQLVQRIDGAGTPKVDQGKAVARFFHNGFSELKGVFARSLRDVKALPSDPQAFASGAQDIGTQIEEGGTRVQTVFSDAQSRFNVPEIDAAFTSDEACSSLHQ